MDAEDACVFIRSLVGKVAGQAAADTVRVQYGGSAQADNATEILAEPNVDGLLVGGASLQAASFLDVIRAGAACYRS
jgi:triosephosphate isomerase